MKKRKLNFPISTGEFPYESEFTEANVVIQTRFPIMERIPVRGRMFFTPDNVVFMANPKEVRTRNKVVFRSKFFSIRQTQDGSFSGTIHITQQELGREKKQLMAEFLKVYSFLSNV